LFLFISEHNDNSIFVVLAAFWLFLSGYSLHDEQYSAVVTSQVHCCFPWPWNFSHWAT